MDQANVNVTTHPTHDQRLLALQEGLILAYCNSWSNYDSTKDTSNIIYNRHLQQQIAEVGKAIGYSIAADSLSDPFYWASLEAARILHHNNMLANGVITFNKRTDWYSSQRPPRIVTYPSVEYSFDVYNSNSVKITFAGRVYTYCMDTNSNNEVFQLTIIDGESFSIQIEPGHTATISGEIKWGSPYAWCLPGTTPYIVLPGDRHSVYWVYEGDRPKHDSIRWDSFHFSIEEWDENSTDEVIDLIKYISHPSHDLHNYLRGIGSSDAISADQLESAPKYYQSLFNAGNPKNQTIHVLPDGKATFWIKLNQTSDSSKAGNIYDGMVTKLKKKFPQLATTLNNGHIEFRDEKSNITVFNAFDPYLKQYVLSLGITR